MADWTRKWHIGLIERGGKGRACINGDNLLQALIIYVYLDDEQNLTSQNLAFKIKYKMINFKSQEVEKNSPA